MAAQEYYQSFGSSSFAPLPSTPAGYPPQQRPPASHLAVQSVPPRPVSHSPAPPPYSPYNGNATPQLHSILKPSVQFASPPTSSPAPQQQYPVKPPQQQIPTSAYLTADGSPLRPSRSYSSPPDNRYYNHNLSESRSRSSSRSSSRSRHHRHRYSSSRDEHARDRAGSYSSRDAGSHHSAKTPHKDMDTFIGAGGGAIIGDAIFPGLGTVGGLLLGGLGGRKYAEKKERKVKGEGYARGHDAGKEYQRDGGHRRAGRVDSFEGERRSRSNVGDYRYKDR